MHLCDSRNTQAWKEEILGAIDYNELQVYTLPGCRQIAMLAQQLATHTPSRIRCTRTRDPAVVYPSSVLSQREGWPLLERGWQTETQEATI